MSQPALHTHTVQTKNLDKYIDSQIESLSSDYAHQHPLPPPPYFDDTHHKKKKSKHHHEPLPNIQILGHTAPAAKNNKPNKSKKKKKPKKKPQQTTTTKADLLTAAVQASSTRAIISGGVYGGSVTPPPPNNDKNNNTVFEFKSASSPKSASASPPKNGSYIHQNGRHSSPRPPLTSNIAKLEQSLQTYNVTAKSSIFGYLNNTQNLKKAHKILGVSNTNTRCQPQNRKHTATTSALSPPNNESMNKNHSNSICSIESLDGDDARNGIVKNTKDSGHADDDNDDSMTIESVSTEQEDKNKITMRDKKEDKKPKIRMWNALAYGLEDPVEGKTFEWVDSKYVRLLQLSTYSTVMGPKVKFVWKNSDIYNLHSIKLQRLHNDTDSDNDSNDSNDSGQEDGYDDDKIDELKPQPRTARPEFAYHELEAWIAKQTLDCTGWKNKHNKTAPPPFTKKTMIAPEFGVVLCCIQFDSSLRALRNKQFNQYINGVYSHTPAQANQSSAGNVAYTPKSTKTPNKQNKFVYTHKPQQKTQTQAQGQGHSSGGSSGGDGVLPTSSPYDHNTMEDSSPNHQFPSFSQKSYSSRYSSPPSGYVPAGDTLADYLSKFAPFSFSAGLSGGMNVSGANILQVPYNRALIDVRNNLHNQQHAATTHNNNINAMHHIDENEDPDDIGHYSLVLAVEYKYFEKFIDCLDAIEHWLYMIASQIRYLLALNKCFKCDQMEHSQLTTADINDDNTLNESLNDLSVNDEDCPDRLHTIIPFMTNIAPSAIFKFDQLFSATFDCTVEERERDRDEHDVSVSDYLSMSSSYLMSDPRDGMLYNMLYIPSRGLPKRISLFATWFTSSLDNRDKHKLSIMISSHLQTLGRTVIIGDDEQEIDRYISTLALFSTSQQKALSRLSVKADNSSNLSSHYIPELYLQGIVIPTIKAPFLPDVNDNNSPSLSEHNGITNDYTATVAYLQSSPAIKQLQEDLYLAPGPSTLVLLTASKHINRAHEEEKQSFWWIRQTAMPHKFKQEQQSLLFQKLFYLRRRRRRRRNSSSYIYARKRSGLFDSPCKIPAKSNNAYLTPPHGGSGCSNESPPNKNAKKSHQHQRTLERKKQQEKDLLTAGQLSSEFKSMNKLYRSHQALNEECEHNGDAIDESDESRNYSVTATSVHSGVTSVQSSIPQPIHAPHLMQNDHKNLTFVEPSLSPMIATIVFGSFNIPQELKMTFLETQFRILLEKASEILLYIEHEQKDLLSFYDKTCHVMSCKEFKEQVPMEALYPQIMQKFESQLRSDLQISRIEDLYVLLSISEGFRPNLFSLMFGNPVFDIEVADILRYFLF